MLDSNLFHLELVPRRGGGVDLVEPRMGDQPSYTCFRADDTIVLGDALSETSLASIKVLTNKLRVITLENPSATVECKSSGVINWEQSFVWEEQTYAWHRDINLGTGTDRGYNLAAVRKPDPDWSIAVYSPERKDRRAAIQILDYNIARVEQLQDKKGLELIILGTLLSYLDLNGARAESPTISANGGKKSDVASKTDALRKTTSIPSNTPSQPIVVERSDEPNVIVVSGFHDVDYYVNAAVKLFKDKQLTFIKFRAPTADAVRLAVTAAADTKVAILKLGEELHQYVIEPDKLKPGKSASGLPKIDLTPKTSKAYLNPPTSIEIYLSRMPLDELAPRSPSRSPATPPPVPPPRPPKTEPTSSRWGRRR